MLLRNIVCRTIIVTPVLMCWSCFYILLVLCVYRYHNNPDVANDFEQRNPDTISLRIFVRPVYGTYFFATRLNVEQLGSEAVAAVCDKEIRKRFATEFLDKDVDPDNLDVRSFNIETWKAVCACTSIVKIVSEIVNTIH